MGRFKYLLTTIAVILLPLVAVSEQIQTNLIQIPIMAEKKAELEAMLFSPVGFAHTMKQKGIAQIKGLLLSQLTNHLAEIPTIKANQKHLQQSMSLRNHKKKNISR